MNESILRYFGRHRSNAFDGAPVLRTAWNTNETNGQGLAPHPWNTPRAHAGARARNRAHNPNQHKAARHAVQSDYFSQKLIPSPS